MRILEVITEAGTIIDPSTGKPFADTPAAPTPAKPSPKKKTNWDPRKLFDVAKKKAGRNVQKMQKYEQFYDNKYGWKARALFKILGFGAAIIQTWATLDELDDMYQKGEIADAATLEEMREYTWGMLVTATIAPTVIKYMANALFVTRIARWIKNGLAVLGAGVTGGASVVAAVATEAGFAWLQSWLTSDKGMTWVKEYLYNYIRFLGKIPDALWDQLTGYYDNAKERRQQSGPPEGERTGQGALAAEPQVSRSTETWPEDIRYEKQNRIFVGDTAVTDHQGFLIPGIQNVLGVQGARAAAKRRKLADPLADIKLKPGTPPVKPV